MKHQFKRNLTFDDPQKKVFRDLGDNELGIQYALIGLLVSEGHDAKGIDFYQFCYDGESAFDQMIGVDVLFTR